MLKRPGANPPAESACPTGRRAAPARRRGPRNASPSTERRIEMNKTQLLIASAMVAALALPVGTGAQSGPAPKPKFEAEKCYGIAKAGKNDCQTANSSCAGTSRRDGQKDAWIYIPAGSCVKLVNGSLQPRA